ncbi:MAG: VOC family protein [Treponema sp.]|jgi:lactoylglutathione lyase|nr:VOC family protein [Treponema sp.]
MTYTHTTVPVSDMDKSIGFYQGLLGLKLVRRVPSGNGELAFLGEAGQPNIELICRPGEPKPVYSGFTLGFRVDSLKDGTAKLEQAGYPLVRGPVSPSPAVTFSFFHDPDGIEIQLLEQSQ